MNNKIGLFMGLSFSINNLLKGFGDHLVRAVRRSANEVAHILAKLGCEIKCVICGMSSSC
jgi:hypothetical protein